MLWRERISIEIATDIAALEFCMLGVMAANAKQPHVQRFKRQRRRRGYWFDVMSM
jgi:hypothetical protein